MSESFDITEGALETWEHAGLSCMIRPSPLGPLNGYVKLPPGHPNFGREYDDIEVDVHGGLTYGCDSHGWVGFDTLHIGDWWGPAELPVECFEILGLSVDQERGFPEWTRARLRAEIEGLAEALAVKGET